MGRPDGDVLFLAREPARPDRASRNSGRDQTSCRTKHHPMKKLTSSFLLSVLVLASAPFLSAEEATVAPPAAPRPRVSPHETINIYAAGNRQTGSLVTLTYGRPYSAKGGKGEPRKIWGGLVPWDKADRLGSDEATLLVTQHPIEIGGVTIP